MNVDIRIAGWVGYCLGVLVLLSYGYKYKAILQSAENMRKNSCVFYVWATSAIVTAVCFILVVALWAMKGNNVTTNNTSAIAYVTGLYIFMAGAITWPYVLIPSKIAMPEMLALWTTALGSIIMFFATLFQPMSIPFTSYIMFHHVVIDALWWPTYKRST